MAIPTKYLVYFDQAGRTGPDQGVPTVDLAPITASVSNAQPGLAAIFASEPIVAGQQVKHITGSAIAGDRFGGTFAKTLKAGRSTNAGILYATDPVTDPTGQYLWERVYSGRINVRWFGAKGDGVTDDSAAIQAAMDAAAAIGGGEVFFPATAARYRVRTCPLLMRSNVSLVGEGERSELYGDSLIPLGAGAWTDHITLIWNGVWTDYPLLWPTLNQHPPVMIGINNAAKGDLTITCTVPGAFNSIAAGEWLKIAEGPGWNPGDPRWNCKIQYSKVLSRVGDTITLERSIEWNFDGTAEYGGTVGCIRMTPVEDAWVKNMALTVNEATMYSSLSGGALCNSGVVGCPNVGTSFDPVTRRAIYIAVNDAYNFIFEQNIVPYGIWAGFNRSSHVSCRLNKFLAVNDCECEMGEAVSFSSFSFNQCYSCYNSIGSAIIGIGEAIHCEVCFNEFYDVTDNVCISSADAEFLEGLRVNFNRIMRSAHGGIYISTTRKQYPLRNIEIIGNYIEVVADVPAIIVSDYPYCEGVTVALNDLSASTSTNGDERISIGTSAILNDRRTFSIFGNKLGWNPATSTWCMERAQIPWGTGVISQRWQMIPAEMTEGSFDAGTLILSARRGGSGNPAGFYVAIGGTYGVLAGVTGSINLGSTALTVNNGTALLRGQYITIVGVSGTKRITWVDGTAVTIDTASDATVAGAAVAFYAPTTTLNPGQAVPQADSLAADVATIVADFNTLLGKLRDSGALMP